MHVCTLSTFVRGKLTLEPRVASTLYLRVCATHTVVVKTSLLGFDLTAVAYEYD